MKAILEVIRAMAEQCEKEKDMFHMPAEAYPYVAEESELDSLHKSWTLTKGKQYLNMEYRSVCRYKPFGPSPDRSHLTIIGKVLTDGAMTDINERYDWDESC